MRRPPASTSWWRAKRPRMPAPAPRASRTPLPANPSGTPAWVNESFLQSLVGQLYGPVTTTTPITVGNQTFPAGHVFRPAADAARGAPADLLARIPGHLHGRSAAVLQPVGHDPYLQRWAVGDVQPVLERPRAAPPFPAGRPDRHADDPRPGRRPGHRPHECVCREHPPVGLCSFRRSDQRAGRRQQRPVRARSRLAVAARVPDRPGRRIRRGLLHPRVFDDARDRDQSGDRPGRRH